MAKLRIEYTAGVYKVMSCEKCGQVYTLDRSACIRGCGEAFDALVLVVDGREITTERLAA